MASFFTGLGSLTDVLNYGQGYLANKEAAKNAAKEAQRAFELEKIRAEGEASRAASFPAGAPNVVQGGTGLAPGIPTWALVGAGVGLLVLVLAMRK